MHGGKQFCCRGGFLAPWLVKLRVRRWGEAPTAGWFAGPLSPAQELCGWGRGMFPIGQGRELWWCPRTLTLMCWLSRKLIWRCTPWRELGLRLCLSGSTFTMAALFALLALRIMVNRVAWALWLPLEWRCPRWSLLVLLGACSMLFAVSMLSASLLAQDCPMGCCSSPPMPHSPISSWREPASTWLSRSFATPWTCSVPPYCLVISMAP